MGYGTPMEPSFGQRADQLFTFDNLRRLVVNPEDPAIQESTLPQRNPNVNFTNEQYADLLRQSGMTAEQHINLYRDNIRRQMAYRHNLPMSEISDEAVNNQVREMIRNPEAAQHLATYGNMALGMGMQSGADMALRQAVEATMGRGLMGRVSPWISGARGATLYNVLAEQADRLLPESITNLPVIGRRSWLGQLLGLSPVRAPTTESAARDIEENLPSSLAIDWTPQSFLQAMQSPEHFARYLHSQRMSPSDWHQRFTGGMQAIGRPYATGAYVVNTAQQAIQARNQASQIAQQQLGSQTSNLLASMRQLEALRPEQWTPTQRLDYANMTRRAAEMVAQHSRPQWMEERDERERLGRIQYLQQRLQQPMAAQHQEAYQRQIQQLQQQQLEYQNLRQLRQPPPATIQEGTPGFRGPPRALAPQGQPLPGSPASQLIRPDDPPELRRLIEQRLQMIQQGR
jgi:hypothetical protein